MFSICGIPYKIEFCKDKFDDINFGLVEYRKARIRINKNLTPELMTETLCHEITHAMLHFIGRQDLSNDETFVQCLGHAIFETFNVNGALDKILEEGVTSCQQAKQES